MMSTSTITPAPANNLHKECPHLILARDIFHNRGQRSKFLILSSYHKTVRKSDLELATHWSTIYARITSEESSAKYARSIVLEETRNITLWSAMKRGELTPVQQINHLIRSRKKWEIPTAYEEFIAWLTAFRQFHQNKCIWTDKLMKDRIQSFSDLLTGFEILHYLRYFKGSRPLFWEEIEMRAVREKNKALTEYLLLKPESYYERFLAILLCLGPLPDESNELYPDRAIGTFHIPRFESYIHDFHTWAGVALLKKHWPTLLHNQLPPGCPLDLRFSGGLMGVFFRVIAYKQHGSMERPDGKDWLWNEVTIPMTTWVEIPAFESSFYKSFYQRLQKSGLWTPPAWLTSTNSQLEFNLITK